jgi:hypothetical protein
LRSKISKPNKRALGDFYFDLFCDFPRIFIGSCRLFRKVKRDNDSVRYLRVRASE